jgi:predicted phage terminase large subunit-like protein
MLAINQKETLDIILEESLKKFSKIKPEDRILYGKNFGQGQLLAFARFIDPNFVTPRHLKLVAEKLEKIEKGKIKRLIICMPPRFGKTYLTSQMFLSWLLGRNPRREIILTSYNDSKAEEYTSWARDICKSDKFKTVFPDFVMDDKKQAAGEWRTEQGGKVIAAGIKGGITGYGAHYLIIDDPVKDYDQAVSDIMQEKVWNRYRADMRTRLYPDAAIIVIMTRWTTTDLAGRLVEHEGLIENGGKWDMLSLPMLDEKGTPLWKEAYDLKEIQDIRSSLGEKIFQALYQQTPVDLVGTVFTDPIFREPSDRMTKIGYIDPAFGGDCDNSLSIGGVENVNNEAKIFITGGYSWKGEIDKTYDMLERIYKKKNLAKLWVEANQAQRIMKYELEKRGLNIGLVTSVKNKHFRIMNNVKLNWHHIYFSSDVTPEYLKQILKYTELAKHQDAADSLAGLIQQLDFGKPKVSERYSGLANFFRGAIR